METHLKINHLAPYLPYELLFLANNEIWQLTTIEFKSNYPIWANNYWNEKKLCFFPEINKKDARSGQGFKLKKIKPILRPLSDLFKLIDWDNNNDPYMIGYKYSISTFKENNKYIYVDEYEADYCSSPKAYVDITSFNWWLFEKHFDVFGLIEQGLAIDINTIK